MSESYSIASARFGGVPGGAGASGVPGPGSTCYIFGGDGPGVTTLSLGEEDGNAEYLSRPVLDGHILMDPLPGARMPAPAASYDSGMQVTTLAIGEEDGGGQIAHSTAAPVSSYDAHSTIGGDYVAMPASSYSPAYDAAPIEGNYAVYDSGYSVEASADYGAVYQVEGTGPGVTIEIRGDYGHMQPVYSPGDVEYDAFARGSTGPEVLNFTYIEPMPKPVAPVIVNVQVNIAQPVQQNTIYAAPQAAMDAAIPPMQSAPVSTAPVDAMPGGDYVSVGSYDSFISGSAPAAPPEMTPVPEPAPAMQYEPAAVEYDAAPMMEADMSSYTEPVSPAPVYGEPVAAEPTYAEPTYAEDTVLPGGEYVAVGTMDDAGMVDDGGAAGWPGADDADSGSTRYIPEPEPVEMAAPEVAEEYTPADGIDAGVKDQDLRITTLAIGEEDAGY